MGRISQVCLLETFIVSREVGFVAHAEDVLFGLFRDRGALEATPEEVLLGKISPAAVESKVNGTNLVVM